MGGAEVATAEDAALDVFALVGEGGEGLVFASVALGHAGADVAGVGFEIVHDC